MMKFMKSVKKDTHYFRRIAEGSMRAALYNGQKNIMAGLRPIDVLAMTYGQHAIIGSGGYFPEDVEDVLHIMKSGRWEIERIITDEYPWEQLPQAIERAAEVEKALNVVIHY